MGNQRRNDVNVALTHGVFSANFKKVNAALAARAEVNGPPGAHYPPIAAACLTDDNKMVDFLIERGADPDGAVHHSLSPETDSDSFDFVPGERALHVVARRCGNAEETIRALVRAGADPNATDGTGRTPLIVACTCSDVLVEVVQALLEASADPSLAEETGGHCSALCRPKRSHRRFRHAVRQVARHAQPPFRRRQIDAPLGVRQRPREHGD